MHFFMTKKQYFLMAMKNFDKKKKLMVTAEAVLQNFVAFQHQIKTM